MTTTITRVSSQYDCLSDLAQPLLVPLSTRVYNRQYAALYDYRLRRLKHPKGRLLSKAQSKWVNQLDHSSHPTLTSSTPSYTKRILDVKQGQVVFVIGTIYVAMHLKPDVLEELIREQYLPPQPVTETYADPARDEIYVEDESGRVRLVGDAVGPEGSLRKLLVTGVIVALLGTETRSGDFEVADAVFAGLPEKEGRKKEEEEEKMETEEGAESQGWVAFVSGLEIEGDIWSGSRSDTQSQSFNYHPESNGSANGENMLGYTEKELRLMILAEWLSGEAGSEEDRQEAAGVSSLVIAGNSMKNALRSDEDNKSSQPRTPMPPGHYPTSTLDNLLSDLASTLDVHLLPGQQDPTSIAMPQQPIHFALLPKTNRFDSLHRETNPAWFGVQGKKFLGTSGQNIDDLYKYSIEEDDEARLNCACRTLQWGHLAPTAPDTLSCYPLSDRDPFLVEEAPHVYFIGNQARFGSRMYQDDSGQKVLVILVPKFSATGQVVLVQPQSLQCKVIEIGVMP